MTQKLTTPETIAAGRFQSVGEWRRGIAATLAAATLAAGLAGCGENDSPIQVAGGGAVAAEVVDNGANHDVDQWETPARPIDDGESFVRSIRGPVGSKAEGHTIHHGDGGITQAYVHPVFGEMYLTFFGDTTVQEATGPNDNRISIDDKQSFSMLHNDLLITDAKTGRVISGVKSDATGKVNKSAFIEVPTEERVHGYDTYFWPSSFAVNPTNGEIDLLLTKQITKSNANSANPGFGFEPTGDNSLVVLRPTDDPSNPFEVASYQRLPRVDIDGYYHEIGAIQFDAKGMFLMDFTREKNNDWAWGYAVGALRPELDNSTGKITGYRRWDGHKWHSSDEWKASPKMGVGSLIPNSVGVEGSLQITRDKKTGENVATYKQFSMLSQEVKTVRSKNLLSGWQVDEKSIHVPKYRSTQLAGLSKADKAVVSKLDEKVITYLGSSFQLHNGKWVDLVSFNFIGSCAGSYKKTNGKTLFSAPKLMAVVANTGVIEAGKSLDLGIQNCLPGSGESWPDNKAP